MKRCCLNTVPKYCLYGHTWRQYKLKQNDSEWQCGSQTCQICHNAAAFVLLFTECFKTTSPLDSFELTWLVCLSIVGRANCVCLILMRGQFEGNSGFGVRSLHGRNKTKRCFCLLCLACLLVFPGFINLHLSFDLKHLLSRRAWHLLPQKFLDGDILTYLCGANDTTNLSTAWRSLTEQRNHFEQNLHAGQVIQKCRFFVSCRIVFYATSQSASSIKPLNHVASPARS